MRYAGDFETTTKEDDCRVWAWGVRSIDTGYEETGKDIDSFMAWCTKQKDARIYFHNLKFDGTFILYYLLENGYKWTNERVLNEKEFSTIITDMGQWYHIKVRFPDINKLSIKVEFYDSLKFIPMSIAEMPKAYGLPDKKLELDYHKERPIGYEMTADEREYLLADIRILAKVIDIMHKAGMKKMTTASNALSNFKKGYSKKYKYDFPELDKDTDVDIRKTYKGGYTYLNPKYKEQDIAEGCVYDVNSMYPWAMKNCLLPYGKPVFFYGEYKPSKLFPLYTISIRCSFKLKPGHFPSIQIKGSFRFLDTEYLTESNGDVIISLTSVDFELMLFNYDVDIKEYYGGYMFKAKRGIFSEYIDYWYKVKDESRTEGNKAMERISKLMLNSLYGKFGANKTRKQKMPYLDEDGILHFKVIECDDVKGGYLPIATFITSWCRDKINRSAYMCGDRFVYADTDSLHIKGINEPPIEIDEHRLGAFKLEEKFKRARFLRQKTYIEIYEKEGKEKMNIKVAGMPKATKEQVTEENFKTGQIFDGKLVPRIVKGGVILRETTFEIKKQSTVLC